MLKVGLTGGIACGKSTVLDGLAARGARTLKADLVAHELMRPGEAVYAGIVEAFGQGILAKDGTIARPRLAAAAFPGRIEELNALVHPAVLAYEDHWMAAEAQQNPAAVIVCEAALLIEAGGAGRYDRLVVVSCPLEQKILRFAERSGMSREAAAEEVKRRMAAQMPEEEKVRRADYVVENAGSREELEAKIASLWEKLRRDEEATRQR